MKCTAGYYCEGNLAAAPTDSTKCTPGHYCPLGSFVQTKCEPGTYQNEEKKDECKPCDEGHYCPTSGLDAPTPCVPDKVNLHCPAGTINPQNCPVGKFASADTKTCEDCPDGKYCWPCPKDSYCFPEVTSPHPGHDGKAGDCDVAKGFVCRKGAHSPEPTYNGYDLIQPNSVAFSSYSGPVIRGYTAKTDGTLEACPIATF